MDKKFFLNKVSTGISGLDKLLFDGLVIPDSPMLIVIRGNDDTERTLLGLQLFYGLAQFMETVSNKSSRPQFWSNFLTKEYLDDLLLDILIAQAIRKMTEKDVSGEPAFPIGNTVTGFFFDTANMYPSVEDAYKNLPMQELRDNLDKLVCKEAIYYNNRTNALHFRTQTSQSDIRNLMFKRRYDSLEKYFRTKGQQSEKDPQATVDKLKNALQMELPVVKMAEPKNNCQGTGLFLEGIDLATSKGGEIKNIISNLLKRDTRIKILIVDKNAEIPDCKADMVIDMENRMVSGYLLQYLRISKSRHQNTALGWHQYKRRDYGMEVYPSLHIYFQQRRYLQRALVYTHSDVITETFQQYLDKRKQENRTANFIDYQENSKEVSDAYFKALCNSSYTVSPPIDVFENIFFGPSQRENSSAGSRHELEDGETDLKYGKYGSVTAIIGESNTYKRFLTYGSSFSSAIKGEHTLILMLNKEDSVVRSRLSCPARRKKGDFCECRKCYGFLHFMNIHMGYITPDEFLYFLEQQIKVKYLGGKSIKRIILDDLQIVDFCFPLLLSDPLFLSAIFSLCRENGIMLHVMCDKGSSLVENLRAQADNTICTERDEKGRLRMYVERFGGYACSPSKIYCGRIEDITSLFECYEERPSGRAERKFKLNGDVVSDSSVVSMGDFWKGK